MIKDPLLASYDEQIRQHPETDGSAGRVERDGRVIRVMSDGSEWTGVVWSRLTDSDPDAVIAEQIARFAEQGRPWEWKHYSYDRPPDLPDRLLAAGFVADPEETLLVAEIADLDRATPPPAGVRLLPVTDAAGVAALVRVHDEAFGGDHVELGRTVLTRLVERPETGVGVLAVAGVTPISGGRVEFHTGTEFASLWGGGTVPEWRGRGVFRALVAYRAALAAAAGFRYLQVDASPESRPILRRLGFVELATTTPFTHSGRRP